MDFYKHLHPTLSREQQENYVRLARHLVAMTQDTKWESAAFDIGHMALDLMTGDELAPDQVAGHEGPLSCGLLGHALRAGLKAQPGEDWLAYQVRVLGAERDNPLEDWLTSHLWRCTDDTPVGAAMRLMYVLDYGVPGDFEAIREGRAESDYLDNGFLWDRIGMIRPHRK